MMKEYRNSLLAAGRSLGTVKQRLGHIEHLHALHPDLMSVTLPDLERFLAERRTSHSAETRKSMRSSFRTFYGWAHRTGRIAEDPSLGLAPIRVPRKVPRLAADGEVQLALVGSTLEESAMILLGRLAGLRLSEIATLHTKHREYDVLRITGKGEKQRRVPINDDLMQVLLELEDERQGGYYFPGRYGGHMHPASVNKIITRRLGANPHSLRHAAATSAYNGTRDLRAVQDFLGHSSLATTERYLHVGLDAVRAAAAATSLPRRGHLRLVDDERPPSRSQPLAA
ncbi:site-specific recombinase XerD [Frigoribacterium sp. PhB160]|uniref:tyrosine-type recombinase/integrase n=1 Tax=Frigoribacterium sp. PhB160 TaxID=2485192 RepID=UPI000F48C83C|nr:tyrosine-type recombinase/integrase [Frigoribacterium sp. PhB160]ROS62220.1 site-specific recombinase XerD [Frigoribacterium sp. PhB160]